MTNREPNDLFDALHEQLHDFGQEPPAHLWAGIRQQLPAPAVPAAPMRRRRWGAGLMLAGLVLLVCFSGWLGWLAGRSSRLEEIQTSIAAVQNSSSEVAQLSVAATGTTETATISPTKNGQPVIAKNQVASTATVAAATSPSADNNLTTSASVVAQQGKSGAATTGWAAVKGRSRKVSQRAIAARQNERRSVFASRRAAPAFATSIRNQRTKQSGYQGNFADYAVSGNASSFTDSNAPQAATNLTTDVAATDAASSAASSQVAVAGARSAESQLDLKLISLNATPWLLPAAGPLLPVDSARTQRPGRQRWAVQLLAGPAVTYRRLGEIPTLAGQIPVLPLYNSNDVSQLERPALGYSAQVQLRRRLGRRWALSTGLGYSEYAHNLELRLVQANSPNNLVAFSSQVVHHRDTYRFLTLPARFTYRLDQQPRRLRLALLAGADLQYYLSSNTLINGPDSAADPSVRSTTAASPYQPLSLSATLGLELRYRLAPRWEAVAQPAATYFLHSLVRDAAVSPPRYLLGAGLQAGLSYDLP